MIKDKLFLLKPSFSDPKFPGERFYCWQCCLLEGLLSYFPELNEKIEICRVAWERPRMEVVQILGVENQSLPLLILSEFSEVKRGVKSSNGHFFINDHLDILNALAEKHGILFPHP